MIQRTMLKSKIHRAMVTDANLNYQGSITIDRKLMEAANMLHYEQVCVVNLNNGARFETYVIEGEPDSGTICLNGAAARLVQSGDRVIIFSFAQVPEDQCAGWKAKVVLMGESNTQWHVANDQEAL